MDEVAAYNNIEQKQIIDKWATFANCYFTVDKWLNIFKRNRLIRELMTGFHPSSKRDIMIRKRKVLFLVHQVVVWMHFI